MGKLKLVWGKVVLFVAAAFGILLYLLQRKQRQINAYKARIDLIKTQKEADLIESEIKKHKRASGLLEKERKDLDMALSSISKRRKALRAGRKKKSKAKSKPKKRSRKKVEDRWNK